MLYARKHDPEGGLKASFLKKTHVTVVQPPGQAFLNFRKFSFGRELVRVHGCWRSYFLIEKMLPTTNSYTTWKIIKRNIKKRLFFTRVRVVGSYFSNKNSIRHRFSSPTTVYNTLNREFTLISVSILKVLHGCCWRTWCRINNRWTRSQHSKITIISASNGYWLLVHPVVGNNRVTHHQKKERKRRKL